MDRIGLCLTSVLLLDLIPDVVIVELLLRDVLEIAVIVSHPSAIETKLVLVPVTLLVLIPLLLITEAEADTCRRIEIDADRDSLIVRIGIGYDTAVLETRILRAGQLELLRDNLQITFQGLLIN